MNAILVPTHVCLVPGMASLFSSFIALASIFIQALSVGVPVVTLPSQLLAGRLTLAMYEKMDIIDVVAKSPNDFVNIALQVRFNQNAD